MDSLDDLSSGRICLSETLHVRRTAALVADAEFIRDAPANEERDDEARRAIREAMLLYTLRRITQTERNCLLDFFSFVTVHEPSPPPERPPHPYFDDPDAHDPPC